MIINNLDYRIIEKTVSFLIFISRNLVVFQKVCEFCRIVSNKEKEKSCRSTQRRGLQQDE